MENEIVYWYNNLVACFKSKAPQHSAERHPDELNIVTGKPH